MATPEEIKFANNRFALQTMLNECFATAEECLGRDCTALGTSLDSFTGPLLGHTIADQHLIQNRTYSGTFKIGFIIASGPSWNPIVFVTSSGSDPVQFPLGVDLSGFDEVRKALVQALKKNGRG